MCFWWMVRMFGRGTRARSLSRSTWSLCSHRFLRWKVSCPLNSLPVWTLVPDSDQEDFWNFFRNRLSLMGSLGRSRQSWLQNWTKVRTRFSLSESFLGHFRSRVSSAGWVNPCCSVHSCALGPSLTWSLQLDQSFPMQRSYITTRNVVYI